MDISVIICSHNPRWNYLCRVMASLKSQTLPVGEWELIVVDNASATPVSEQLDLSWHPHARIVVENDLGLTPARARGIRESTGKALVFVDDDNVLDQDYLAQALEIMRRFPWIGAWGGHIEGEFEIQPPAFSRHHLHYLALRNVKAAKWACDTGMGAIDFAPCGAGMCLSRNVALAYLDRLASDQRLKELDRKGQSLTSCGDTDMALTACDTGLAVGLFPELRLQHLIPAARLQRDYLKNLVIGVDSSLDVLRGLRCGETRKTYRAPSPLQQMISLASMFVRKARGQWSDADEFRREIQNAKR